MRQESPLRGGGGGALGAKVGVEGLPWSQAAGDSIPPQADTPRTLPNQTLAPQASPQKLSSRTLPPQEARPLELPSQRLSPQVPPPQAPTPHARNVHLASVDLTTHQSPGALCPNDLSPSDASYILQSVTGSFSSPGPTVNAAASWWFDLLANDAARDHQQVPAIPTGYGNDSLPFECPPTGGQVEITSLQRATQVLDPPHVNGIAGQGSIVSPSQSSNADEEEHIWQSREPIELLPREHFLFEHFVQHVSQWVGDTSCGSCLLF